MTREELVRTLEREFGTHKKVVDLETGIAHRVPVRDIALHGLKQTDLHTYPRWDA